MRISKLMCFLCVATSLLCVQEVSAQANSTLAAPKAQAAPKVTAVQKAQKVEKVKKVETLQKVETVRDFNEDGPGSVGDSVPLGAGAGKLVR